MPHCCPNHRIDLGHARTCAAEVRRLRRIIDQLHDHIAELELRAAATIHEDPDH